jgi:glycosyltransferase involved in cell wall biosynthesis
VASVARRLSGKAPSRLTVASAFAPNSVAISWGPGFAAMLAAVLGRRLVHLCWGVPRPSTSSLWSALRMLRLKVLLRRASAVLVNEIVTKEDVRRIAKREAILVPYVVDTAFFSPVRPAACDEFVLVPGNNGRNEELVCAISAMGVSIIRVTLDVAVRDYYAARQSDSSLPDVRFAVSYTELRNLYRCAALVLLPLRTPNHPAGQTAVLEALACGTPVLLSRGRIASAVRDYPGVHVYESDSPNVLRKQIETLAGSARIDRAMGEKIHSYVNTRHSPSVVAARLEGVLSSVL